MIRVAASSWDWSVGGGFVRYSRHDGWGCPQRWWLRACRCDVCWRYETGFGFWICYDYAAAVRAILSVMRVPHTLRSTYTLKRIDFFSLTLFILVWCWFSPCVMILFVAGTCDCTDYRLSIWVWCGAGWRTRDAAQLYWLCGFCFEGFSFCSVVSISRQWPYVGVRKLEIEHLLFNFISSQKHTGDRIVVPAQHIQVEYYATSTIYKQQPIVL